MRVRPGPDGLQAFLRQLEVIVGRDVANVNFVFRCRCPDTGAEIFLQGLQAFEAAMHCACVRAAQRSLQQQQQQQAQLQQHQQQAAQQTQLQHVQHRHYGMMQPPQQVQQDRRFEPQPQQPQQLSLLQQHAQQQHGALRTPQRFASAPVERFISSSSLNGAAAVVAGSGLPTAATTSRASPASSSSLGSAPQPSLAQQPRTPLNAQPLQGPYHFLQSQAPPAAAGASRLFSCSGMPSAPISGILPGAVATSGATGAAASAAAATGRTAGAQLRDPCAPGVAAAVVRAYGRVAAAAPGGRGDSAVMQGAVHVSDTASTASVPAALRHLADGDADSPLTTGAAEHSGSLVDAVLSDPMAAQARAAEAGAVNTAGSGLLPCTITAAAAAVSALGSRTAAGALPPVSTAFAPLPVSSVGPVFGRMGSARDETRDLGGCVPYGRGGSGRAAGGVNNSVSGSKLLSAMRAVFAKSFGRRGTLA